MSAPEINESLKSVVNWLNWLLERDPLVHAPPVMDYVHHAVHEGGYFNFGTYQSLNGTLAIHLRAGPTATLRPHFTHKLFCEGAARLDFYQNPSFGTLGTLSAEVWNSLIGDSGTATAVIRIHPAVSNLGTWRAGMIIGGTGVGGSSTSGDAERMNEIVPAINSDWLTVITTGSALNVIYTAGWYEK